MKNVNSSSGIGEDIIRSIVQLGSAEMHLKTLMEKTLAEMENGIVDVTDSAELERHYQLYETYKAEILEVAQARREAMLFLFDMYKTGDDGIDNIRKQEWCLVKHYGIASMTIFESWQASDDNPALLTLAYNTNKLFIKSLSRFIGAEIEDCASCFSDFLKASGKSTED